MYVGYEVQVEGLADVKLTLKKLQQFVENPPTRALWREIFKALARMYEFRFKMARHMQKTRQWEPYRAEYGIDTGRFYRSLTQVSGALGGIRIMRKWEAQYGMRWQHGHWVSGGVPGRNARAIGIRTRTAKKPGGWLVWRGAPGITYTAKPHGGKPAQTKDTRPPKPIKPAKILLVDKDMTRLENMKFDMRIKKFVDRYLDLK